MGDQAITINGWTNGTNPDGSYSRYDASPWFTVPESLEILAEYDWAGDYEFDMIVIWRHKETAELRAAADSGCSCPTPFSGLTWEAMLPINEPDDLRLLIDHENGPYSVKWDDQDEGTAVLKAAVHRSLRERNG